MDVASAEDIKQRIEAAIPGSLVEVEDYAGDSNHFRATVTAEAFEGLGRIAQHRLVYDALDGDVGGAIHAFTLKTQTPSSAPAA
jgi:stress-induced morphogen